MVAGFETCFQDRASAKDPSAVPPSCQRVAAQGQGRVGQVVAATARRRDFSDAFQRTLLFEMAVFLLCLVLTFLLPDPRGRAAAQAPAEVPAGA